jgi:LPPG:FO 2-phospho-L-lactate transferase
MRVTALAGGVGAARFLWGLKHYLGPEELSVIVNTGDDFEWMGLHVSPDLDTITYTLAGIANPETGWGLKGDTFACLQRLVRLGGDDWFRVGDLDLTTHLYRTCQLRSGAGLASVTRSLALALGARAMILPMTECVVPTRVHTAEGTLEFQDYFVRRKAAPQVTGFTFQDIESASPGPGVLEAVETAAAILICPSNPFVSIEPILAVPGIRTGLRQFPGPKLAVSPIIGGRAVKGPAAKMMRELGHEVSALGVARIYQGLIDIFVLDREDEALRGAVESLGLKVFAADTFMDSPETRKRLARQVLEMIR